MNTFTVYHHLYHYHAHHNLQLSYKLKNIDFIL